MFMKHIGSIKKKILAVSGFFVLLLLVAAAGALYAGGKLVEPVRREIGPPPADLGAVDVEFRNKTGTIIRGWLIDPPGTRGTVILMHGVRADRRSMANRARFLKKLGYSVLLFDFQAHGESQGEMITFGHLESKDAEAAVNFVKALHPNKPVAAIGVSLGGAAAVLADPPLELDGLIVESVYPTINEAVSNRLRMCFGRIGPFLTPLLTLQIGPRLGISLSDLRPIDKIRRISCPLFVMAGTDDQRTTLAESLRLYETAGVPKQFWPVKGAGHIDLHRHAGKEYEVRVRHFLAENLPG